MRAVLGASRVHHMPGTAFRLVDERFLALWQMYHSFLTFVGAESGWRDDGRLEPSCIYSRVMFPFLSLVQVVHRQQKLL